MTELEGGVQSLLSLGMGISRTAAAFLFLPILNGDVAPTLVRNSLFVGMGLIVLALQPRSSFSDLSAPMWAGMFSRELFLGAVIGFFWGGVLWSMQMAGDLVDQKINTVRFSLSDPFSGSSSSIYGGFFARLALFAFAGSGGFIYMVTTMLESYALWPIGGASPRFHPQDLDVFETIFGRLIRLSLEFSAPTLVLMLMLDGLSGLVNRFSPRFNVFSAAAALKMWFSVFAVAITATTIVSIFISKVLLRGTMITDYLVHSLR